MIAAFFYIMWKKFLYYLKRYGFAELAGGVLVVIGASAAYYLSGDKILAAYVGAISENIGFYGAIIIGDFLKAGRGTVDRGGRQILSVLKNIALEFGGAEVLDSLVMRPAILYLFTTLISNYELGVLAGVVVSDVLFYCLAVISSELTLKYRSKKAK